MIIKQDFIVKNDNGLHARPSASLVKAVSVFESTVSIKNEHGSVVDGKSIMGVMTLMAGKGSKLTFTVTGKDAPYVIKKISDLFTSNFGEKVLT